MGVADAATACGCDGHDAGACGGERGLLGHRPDGCSSAELGDGRASVPNRSCRPVVGRFAPSPTGRMHLGNVYALLMAWLSARSQQGRVVLRIEDLDDRSRSGPWDTLLMDDLRWLGLDWDEGPYYQTDQLDLYRGALAALADAGLVYPCFCTRAELHAASAPHASDGTPVYAGTCRDLSAEAVAERSRVRPPAQRLRVPGAADPAGEIAFADRVYGERHETLARECGDFLVRRSDGVFAYQLAVVVDDVAMGVTEVVRGCDLLGSTARQVYLQNLLGYAHPCYAHVPLVVAPDGRRLSKRDRDCDMGVLRERFGTPERLLGWLAHAAGLAPSAEPVSAEQLADGFSWDAVRARHEDIMVSGSPVVGHG